MILHQQRPVRPALVLVITEQPENLGRIVEEVLAGAPDCIAFEVWDEVERLCAGGAVERRAAVRRPAVPTKLQMN
jgi:hypothetical protein